jgi:hypothetical protein
MPQASAGAVVGDDPVAEANGLPSRGHPADHGGGVEVLPPQGGDGRFPAAGVILHAQEVGNKHVVVGVGVAGPGGGVTGDGVDQAGGGCEHAGPAPPAADVTGQGVEVGQGGVALGVHDAVHVLGPADHAELGHALVGGDDQLHPRPAGANQALAGGGVDRPARAVEGGELGLGHRAHQAQGGGARTTPRQRRLASRGVVLQRLAGVIVGPLRGVGEVVGHRIGSHHRHPRHRSPNRRLKSSSRSAASTTGVISVGTRQLRPIGFGMGQTD